MLQDAALRLAHNPRNDQIPGLTVRLDPTGDRDIDSRQMKWGEDSTGVVVQ